MPPEDKPAMTAADAIQILAGKMQGSRYAAIAILAADVAEESRYGDPDHSLMDWITAGDWTGAETVETIAADWDDREE